MSVHIEEKKTNIAKIVLMPGDPKRAKFIAEKYLKKTKKINGVRNMDGYTGKYDGKIISVIPSGMGIPSIGIYAHELFSFFDVDIIIRIGTCGTYNKNVGDLILAKEAHSFSNFAFEYNGYKERKTTPCKELNDMIIKKSNEKNLNIYHEKVFTTDSFYKEDDSFALKYEAIEMETFGLFHVAKSLNKKAASLFTVSDVIGTENQMTAEEREKSLTEMIELVLESIKNI